ncbi:MAG TPA: SLBB domain-containing protein [Terracidiphilus sp.]|nr:SLBB domain-containing protein [Terracidiphilus sp.]
MTAPCAHVLAQTGYTGNAQSPSTWDCSDPLLANTSECSGQGQETTAPLVAPQAPSPLSPQVGGNGAQPQSPARNYSDIEQLSRQAAAFQAPLPPQPLTEFQKFAASTTGQVLPIFGADLFRRVPSTFAPLNLTPVPSDYVIGPGDELRIRAWGQVNFQANVRVDRSGEIYVPQVGPVHVAGMPYSALDAQLRAAIGRVYRNFEMTVDVGQIRAIQIYVAGEARRPGVYTVSSLSTLVDALFASGGPSVEGSLRHIELRRGSAVIANFDLYDLLIRGDKSKDAKLLPGDVIFIPPVGAQAAVTGSVRNPGIYELKAGESLSSLLGDAGGTSAVAAEARISIERIADHRDRHVMEVAYDQSGLATPMADGDVVRVYSIVPMYQKTVILRGNTANPGRFSWHPGMRVSELIPDKESLITRNYWWKRAQLGLPVPEFEPTMGLAYMRQPADKHVIPLSIPPPETANIRNQYEPRRNQDGSQQNQYGPQQNQYGAQQNQYGFQQNQNLSAQQRAGNASLAAEQTGLSSQALPPAQRTEVGLLAPEIDWNYAVIERLDAATLKTSLIPFDLGKLVLQHDASQDLELQAGDVVTIFSQADIRVPVAQQTKLVRLDGEFVHAGVYTVQPGETLRQLVERAGGFTPNAYLFGSEFTRESTRALQQARIDEYVRDLSMRMQRSSLNLAAASAGSPQVLAGGAAAQTSEQDLLSNLRRIRATGRIVLELKPNSSGIASLPDIALEDGDRFVVPHVPVTVNVVGAVYDQNSFLYAQGERAGAYLKLAGGATKDADSKHEFIIRADGEVVSRNTRESIWGNSFDNLRMNPGDTIVIPEKTFKPSALVGMMNWSQMFSQLALGAAMVGVLP